MIISTVNEARLLDLHTLDPRKEPDKVLMCPPDYFDVKEVKNPYMQGRIGGIDRNLARRQWEALRGSFEKLGKEVVAIEAAPGLEDMVFSANQVLPALDQAGRPLVVLSKMRYESRRPEVAHYRKFFERREYRILELDGCGFFFEGQGDALWHPGKRLLWGGWGYRTSKEAYQPLSEALGVPVIILRLVRPEFYHMDTCFMPLSNRSAIYCPDAFTPEGVEIIRNFFPESIEIEGQEAEIFMPCNAVVIDSKFVVLPQGSPTAATRLRKLGFETVEVDNGEFLKSGGGAFCLKMMIY